jgi:hypothetical protein
MNKGTVRSNFTEDEIVVSPSVEKTIVDFSPSGEKIQYWSPKLQCPFTVKKDCERLIGSFRAGRTYVVRRWPVKDRLRNRTIPGLVRDV